MPRAGWFLKSTLLIIALSLGAIAIRPYVAPAVNVSADALHYDHILIISAAFLYQGSQGVLVLDKRNGNVWFFGRAGDNMTVSFKDPQFLIRLPLEKLDQAPR
jgi:hypothetical protein